MSPAPQGNLEVEKYIGSYLISQRVPPNIKSSTGTKRFQNQHVKQKSPETEKVRNFNKHCFPQRDHARYSMPPGQLPIPVEYGNSHYKHPGGGWAGVPLISMTSGNHRRNKKVPTSTNHNQIQKYPHKHAQQNGYANGKEEEPPEDSDRSPLTRLAIHTQGAPLIQAGRYGNGNRCRNGFNREQTRVYRGDCGRWDTTKDPKSTVGVHNQNQPGGNADSSSVASDESSGNSENSLPRIIKPRKRRKKDRKPITGTISVAPSTSNEPSQYPGGSDQKAEPTLKQYLPLCFEHDLATNASESRAADLLPETPLVSSVEEKQSEDLIDTFTSADEFPFGNLLDDEEDKDSEPTMCGPASASLCQCRYCDPSGVIWDVDQRCYSPFLTPPSPTDLKLPLGTSLPLSFAPYNRQVSIGESPPLPQSRYSFNTDLGSLLRRSWSDPSSYKKPEHLQIFECGREKPESRPSSPFGLQVSSEIVTSPNGHRDIEIKFYSSPSNLDPFKAKLSASDRDRNDRCFVVEE